MRILLHTQGAGVNLTHGLSCGLGRYVASECQALIAAVDFLLTYLEGLYTARVWSQKPHLK